MLCALLPSTRGLPTGQTDISSLLHLYVNSPINPPFLTSDEAMEPAVPELAASEVPTVRKPNKETTWIGPKESAVRQHRQEMKTKMKNNKVEELKPMRPKQVRPMSAYNTFLKKQLMENDGIPLISQNCYTGPAAVLSGPVLPVFSYVTSHGQRHSFSISGPSFCPVKSTLVLAWHFLVEAKGKKRKKKKSLSNSLYFLDV